jgi:hypothetical protein
MFESRAESKKFSYYQYDPSLAAAVIFALLFGISTCLHAFQSIRRRAWFMTPFIIGGAFETVGYIGRAMSAHDPYALHPFIIQTLLILLGPALFAASIYMVLGRIILLTNGEPYSLIRRTWLTKIFVTSDVLSFLLQCGGGSIMASNQRDADKVKLGQNVILIGLFGQNAIFGLFIVVAVLFQIRGRAHFATLPSHVTWAKHLNVLYATCMLILIRSVFRVVEYLMGAGSFLLEHEVFTYVFDGLLMLTAMVLVNVVHPGDIATLLKEKDYMGRAMELKEAEHTGKGQV